MPTATSKRPPVGHKRHPYGWSARQAAQLADIPARTVQQWAVDGLVAPTYTNPALGIDQPIYTLGDVVRLRLARDLLEAGVDRPVVTLASQELATHPQPDHFWDHRRIAHKRWWLYLPHIEEFIPRLQQRSEGVVVFVGDDTVMSRVQHPEPGHRHEQRGRSALLYVDVPDEPAGSDFYNGPIAVYYPLWQAIDDITHAVEIWRCKNGIKLQDLPPWM
jgi:DNA-binding transcriptional MerR regulator